MTRFREKARSMLPKGVATFLPEATARKRFVEESILSVFARWGYQELITPLFEYLDVIAAGLGEGLIEKGYKLVDRSTGRLMLLRPDVTPQIARLVAMLMADRPKPLRLSYRANVFRHEEEHAGRAREVYQIGGELVGLEGAQADAETIAIAIESLLSLGLMDFKMVLGHSEFFRGLLGSLDVSMETKHRIRLAMAKKDISYLKGILSATSIPNRKVQALLALPRLFGGLEVIERAEKLSKDPVCRQALTRLREIYGILKSSGWEDRLLVDLSEVRGFDYYTGIIFEVFVKNLGFPVGRGGRYDHLIGKFGKPCPSTGFAFDIENVQWAWQQHLSAKGSSSRHPAFRAADILLVDPSGDFKRLFRVASVLREKGLRIIQQSGRMKRKEISGYAKDNGISAIVILDTRDGIVLTDVETGKSEKMKLNAFILRSTTKFRLRFPKSPTRR